jgi:hypothetical protein
MTEALGDSKILDALDFNAELCEWSDPHLAPGGCERPADYRIFLYCNHQFLECTTHLVYLKREAPWIVCTKCRAKSRNFDEIVREIRRFR